MATRSTESAKLPQVEHTRLGNSGLKISRVIVGGMSYGVKDWRNWVLTEEEALPVLKHAYDCGINTWDTADFYSYGHSEKIIKKAIEHYKIPRERLVLMTKCYYRSAPDDEVDDGAINLDGLSRKHIFDAVQNSVERLGTYIDVLQIHRLDQNTPAKEIMRALNDVIEKGWVRYIGASSMYAWEFQNLQWIARINGWHEFISMQGYHNLLYREEEREMIPYCKSEGIGLIPWSPLARGVLARPWDSRSTLREQSDGFLATEIRPNEGTVDEAIINRVEEIAKKHNVSMACVATAWSIRNGSCPIIGMNTKERVEQAVFNSRWKLSDEDAAYLEEPYRPRPIIDFE